MRILHIVSDIRKLGNGGVYVAIDLACLQAKSGHQVAILSGDGEYRDLLKQYGVLHLPATHSKKVRPYLTLLGKLQDAVAQFKPDIVHVHTMISATAAWMVKILGTYKLVSTVHNEFQKSSVLMGLADRVIVLSNAGAHSMQTRGIAKSKIRIVPNGIIGSPRSLSLLSYSPAPLHHPAIVSVGGLHLRKGHIELIQAFDQIAKDFPNAHLYLVGNGAERSIIEAEASKTDVTERIHFEGFQEEPQRYLLAGDIFVLASHQEPCSLAIAEAREAGCAIIATDVDGNPELLEHGRAGILTPPKNSKVLAGKLSQLLRNPAALREWREKAQNNLNWLSVARANEQVLQVYQELL